MVRSGGRPAGVQRESICPAVSPRGRSIRQLPLMTASRSHSSAFRHRPLQPLEVAELDFDHALVRHLNQCESQSDPDRNARAGSRLMIRTPPPRASPEDITALARAYGKSVGKGPAGELSLGEATCALVQRLRDSLQYFVGSISTSSEGALAHWSQDVEGEVAALLSALFAEVGRAVGGG